jgi:hypothetical protein
MVNKPPDLGLEYSRIKKDIYHGFSMPVLPVNHGLRPIFLRSLRDHMMRWDPNVRQTVDHVCQKEFKLSFDQMLIRNPRWIQERVPRTVPTPSVLVLSLQHVYDTLAHGRDAKSGQMLFNKQAEKKFKAVLELAREGYLSDIPGVKMYVKTSVDKYGLQKYRCLRGTNKVEGGPHGDIYRKFAPLQGKFFSFSLSTH